MLPSLLRLLKVVWVFRVSLPLHLDITREKSIHLYLMMALLRNKSPKKSTKVWYSRRQDKRNRTPPEAASEFEKPPLEKQLNSYCRTPNPKALNP